jgi:hypothetical protein
VGVRSGAGRRKVEMAISYFRILRSVILDAVGSFCDCQGITQDEAFATVREYLHSNRAEYYTDSPNLNYEDPLCRIAYLFTYVAAHANVFENALYAYDELKGVIEAVATSGGEQFEVCSLGGGPGSELLGLARFIERRKSPGSFACVEFVLIDRIREWAETWDALYHGLQDYFRDVYGSDARLWPLLVSRSFLPVDLTKTGDYANFATMFSQRLFVLNYVVSELLSSMEEFAQVFNIIAQGAPQGAHFIFIDRGEKRLEDYVERLVRESDLEFCGIRHKNESMDTDQDKADLGKLLDLVGDNSPQLTWRAFFALARKPEIPF